MALRAGGVAVSAAVVIAFCVLTWRQQALYRDVDTLWRLTLEKDPKCWLAHNNLGVSYLNRGMHDEALVHLHKTIELMRHHCAAHTNIGIIMMARKNYDEAYRFMSRAVVLCPDWPTGLGNLAKLLIRLRNYDAAKQHLIESMEKDPGRVRAHYDLGAVFYDQEDFHKAIFHCEKVIAKQPDHAEAHYVLGMARYKEGQHAESLPYLQKAAALRPNKSEWRNRVAHVLSRSPETRLRNGAEAVRYATRACELSRYQVPSYIRTLASSYAATGDFNAAMREADKAASLAKQKGNTELAAGIEADRNLYRQRMPARDASGGAK